MLSNIAMLWKACKSNNKISPVIHPMLKKFSKDGYEKMIFQINISSITQAYLLDHKICNTSILPASAFYELNIASFNKISANHHISVMKAIIKCPLPIRGKCDADALVEISKAHCTFDVQLDKKSYFCSK